MGKSIHSTVQAAIDSGEFTGVLLAQLHFSNDGSDVRRYTNAYQTIYWDEAGMGEVEYLGLGNLASISTLEETSELGAQTIQLTISGIPNDTITDIFGDDYIGEPCYIWYATLNPQTYAVEGGQAGPVLIFAGRMDYGTMTFGNTATISVNATSRLADWERARGGRFNHSYQRTHVDPTDFGFVFVQALQNLPISWGGVTLSDPGSSDNDGANCFDKGTKFFMHDGTLKEIQNIVPGDYMLKGGKVVQILFGLGEEENWYDYRGIIVTGEHPVLENGIWKNVEDSEQAVPTYTRSHTYIVCSRNNILIAENGIIFTDYDCMPASIWEDWYSETSMKYLNGRTEFNKELEQLKL